MDWSFYQFYSVQNSELIFKKVSIYENLKQK